MSDNTLPPHLSPSSLSLIPNSCAPHTPQFDHSNTATPTTIFIFPSPGPRLASVAMSDDMKPAVRALLEAEYGRVGYDPKAGKVLSKVRGLIGEGGHP